MIEDERMNNNEEMKNSVPDNTNNGSIRSLTAFIRSFFKDALKFLTMFRLYLNDFLVGKAFVYNLNSTSYCGLKECQDE